MNKIADTMNWVSLKLVVARLKESVERNYYLSRNDEAEQAHEKLIEAEFKLHGGMTVKDQDDDGPLIEGPN